MKWTKEDLTTTLKANLNDTYGASVMVAALYKEIFNELPKIGLSGYQASAAESLAKKIREVLAIQDKAENAESLKKKKRGGCGK